MTNLGLEIRCCDRFGASGSHAVLGPRVAGAWLAIITIAVSMVSGIMVEAIQGSAEQYGISSVFICAVLIPMVSGGCTLACPILHGLTHTRALYLATL